jgi:poly(3-hydroxybutyrate) depolymerase
VQDGLDLFADANLCEPEQPEVWEAELAVCQNYRSCMPYSAVELCLVEGGHAWPGSKQSRRQRRLHIKVSPFPASREIWDFFTEFLP